MNSMPKGGVAGRGGRYRDNCRILMQGMVELGFKPLLDTQHQAPIILAFHTPPDANFEFEVSYDRLRERGFVIYPGRLTVADSFRIGCIGQLGSENMHQAFAAIRATLDEMQATYCQP